MAASGDEISSSPADHGHLRASNSDREQVIDVLKIAFVQGRLSRDELDLRVGQALRSRTYAEQAAVIADLPIGLMRAEQPAIMPRRTRSRARGTEEVRTGLRVIGVATVLAALFWVIAIVAMGNGPAFIAASGTTGVVLVASALTGSAALGSRIDKRHGRPATTPACMRPGLPAPGICRFRRADAPPRPCRASRPGQMDKSR